MGAMSSAEIWGSAEWRGAATAWLDDGLADAGIERTGEVEQPHVRPWATVLRAPTTAGPVWLKATAPGTSAEIGLYALLREVVPEQVLQPIAIDLERSWIVLPDGGPRLDDWLTEVDLAEAMAEIVPAYARLQRALVPHTDRMLALGLADMRPAMLPQRFEEALAVVAPDLERAGEEGRRAYEQLLAAHDTVGSWCGELAGLPGAASVDHSDLHQWNVLIGRPDGMARPRFYDWGDAVSHTRSRACWSRCGSCRSTSVTSATRGWSGCATRTSRSSTTWRPGVSWFARSSWPAGPARSCAR